MGGGTAGMNKRPGSREGDGGETEVDREFGGEERKRDTQRMRSFKNSDVRAWLFVCNLLRAKGQ